MGQPRTDQHATKRLLVGFNYADQHATNLLLVGFNYVTLQTSLYTLFVALYVVHIRYDFISLPLFVSCLLYNTF